MRTLSIDDVDLFINDKLKLGIMGICGHCKSRIEMELSSIGIPLATHRAKNASAPKEALENALRTLSAYKRCMTEEDWHRVMRAIQ